MRLQEFVEIHLGTAEIKHAVQQVVVVFFHTFGVGGFDEFKSGFVEVENGADLFYLADVEKVVVNDLLCDGDFLVFKRLFFVNTATFLIALPALSFISS